MSFRQTNSRTQRLSPADEILSGVRLRGPLPPVFTNPRGVGENQQLHPKSFAYAASCTMNLELMRLVQCLHCHTLPDLIHEYGLPTNGLGNAISQRALFACTLKHVLPLIFFVGVIWDLPNLQ